MQRSVFVKTLVAAAAVAATGLATAQAWPNRPVRLIVAAPPGTVPDIVGRLMGDQLSRQWGQPVIVENKVGAGGMIAMEYVKSATPDGYTLILGNAGAVVIAPQMFKAAKYDPVADFTQLGNVAEAPFVIVANNEIAKTSLTYMIARAKANPEKINLGSTELASLPHLLTRRLAQFTGTKFNYVPFNNSAQAIPALVKGDLDYYSDSIAPMLPLIRAGRVKVVAVSSDRIYPGLEAYPLMKDTVPNFSATGWFALMGPKGLPADMVARINKEVTVILDLPDIKKRFYELALFPAPKTPFETTYFIKSEITKWNAVMRNTGMEKQ